MGGTLQQKLPQQKYINSMVEWSGSIKQSQKLSHLTWTLAGNNSGTECSLAVLFPLPLHFSIFLIQMSESKVRNPKCPEICRNDGTPCLYKTSLPRSKTP